MTAKNTLAAAFDITQTHNAVREVAHLYKKVTPIEKTIGFKVQPLSDVVVQTVLDTVKYKIGKSGAESIFASGFLMALPDAPKFALFVGSILNENTNLSDDIPVQVYALPAEIAHILQADPAEEFLLSPDGSHIPVGASLSFGQKSPHFKVFADKDFRDELSPELIEKYKLKPSAKPFVDLLLSQFWAKSYEQNYFAFRQDSAHAKSGVVFAFPSLLRIAGLCIDSALRKHKQVMDASCPVNLDFASRDIGNYAKLLQNDYRPFYWGTLDFFLTATWETAIGEALEAEKPEFLSSMDYEALMDLECVTENFQGSTTFMSPKRIVAIAQLDSSSTKDGENGDYRKLTDQRIFAVSSEEGFTPVEGKSICSSFAHPSCNYTTTLFSPDQHEVSEQAGTIAQLIGDERHFQVAPARRFPAKMLRNIYCLEVDITIRAIDKLSCDIQAKQVIPF